MIEAILIAVLTLALSFFFSGMEIAFISSSRLKIELKTVQGERSAKILSYFKKHTSEVLITILIGNNLALVVFTIMMETILQPGLTQIGLDPEKIYLAYTFVQTIISTLIILVLAEYIPKAIFRRNADRLVFPAAYILNFFYYLLYIPVWAVNVVSKLLLRALFQVTTDERIVELGKKDLDHYIQEMIAVSENVPVEDLDTEMLTNALAFKETKARECMIPRTEMIAAPIDTEITEIIDQFIDTRLSKIIIYEESLDNVKGFVHSSGIFAKPEKVQEIIQPVLVVPESMQANVLLGELTENQRSVAIVVDEFGGTSGMITMEDLVEEVFGEIEDEHDVEKEVVIEPDMVKQMNDDGSYLLGGRLEIDDLNEEFDLKLPEEEYYTTLGGLIMYISESIPDPEETLDIANYQVTIVEATSTRIISVRLRPLLE